MFLFVSTIEIHTLLSLTDVVDFHVLDNERRGETSIDSDSRQEDLFARLDISYNLPKFCSYPAWNPIATTLAKNITGGMSPYGLFIDVQNTIYAAFSDFPHIVIWDKGSHVSTRMLSVDSNSVLAIFVTGSGEIYVAKNAGQVMVLNASNSTKAITLTPMDGICWGLFVDLNNSLYCSMKDLHQVTKMFENSDATGRILAAGNGSNGSAPNLLNQPHGIFVTVEFDLYVADSSNGRIQRFTPRDLTGTTVAGGGVSGCASLFYPMGIILDADEYLYIAEYASHRIVQAGARGCRCLVGCSSVSGSEMHQLHHPRSLSFDRSGNIYVTELDNQRIQKFSLASNACGTSRDLPLLFLLLEKRTVLL